ncbi:MAG: redoxin domain-containing protein, partial [Candidatus Marinimicrobia bacterium]|nr:redoxin domain-containing protein [Candidatus Neomarinimicrobiota bacterium]
MSVLVGRKAPDFTTQAVLADDSIVGDYNFTDARNGKYAVVFFYPLDFTFVCPS